MSKPKQHGKKAWLHVEWLTGGTSWVPMSVVRRDQPFVIIDYVQTSHPKLLKTPRWSWINKYLENKDELDNMVQAFKTSVT